MVLPLGQLPIESKQADRTIRKVAEAASGAVCAGSNPAGGATRRLLTRLVGSGSTVLFSSHVMELVEQVCDHVSIIDQGKIVASGTTDQVAR